MPGIFRIGSTWYVPSGDNSSMLAKRLATFQSVRRFRRKNGHGACACGASKKFGGRLAVYQAIRNSGCLPLDAGFHLVSWQIDAMASLEAESSLPDLDDRMGAIEKAYELETGKPWPPDDVSPEYEELLKQYNAVWDQIFVMKLDASGEQEMARLYRADREEFHRRGEAGRQYFHGPGDPVAWLFGFS